MNHYRIKHPRPLLALLCTAALLGTISQNNSAQTPTQPAAAPSPLVRETARPVRVIHRDDGVFFIDLGTEAFGYLVLELPGLADNEARAKVLVRMGEKRADPEHLDPHPGGSVRFLQTSLAPEPGNKTYRSVLPAADARGMPADIGPVMPFRYVELENLPPDATEQLLSDGGLWRVAVHYPFDDSAAAFACTNLNLDAIWALSKNTIKATSFTGLFIDGDRERKPYEADAYINTLGWYYCTTDTSLPRLTQDYLITHPTWPTEWIMFSVLTADLEYRYTGDTTDIAAHYDDLKAKTLRALERDDGLISTVQPPVSRAVNQSIHFTGQLKDIVDWPENQRDGYQMVPVNTVVNAFHCRSLQIMADLAEALGKKEDAADFRNAAGRTLQSLNSKLTDPNTGLYLDGQGSTHSSLHANMFPLAFGLVPENRRAKVVDFIQSRGMACSPYGAQFLLEALFNNGRGRHALELIYAPGNRSWQHMAHDLGQTITPEAWDLRDKPNEDWTHAWSAAPANLLPRMVLGVEPLEPGYAKTLIWPRGAGLDPRAQPGAPDASVGGKVPTVKGPVTVHWGQNARGFAITIDVPPGTLPVVRLPDDWGDAVLVDNLPFPAKKQDHWLEVEIITPGKHTLTVGKP